MSKTLQRNLEAKLAAMNGPDWDSSDEEDEAVTQSRPMEFLDNGEATDPTNGSTTTKKNKKGKKQSNNGKQEQLKKSEASNVVYIGHLPIGFEEHQMKGFFEQFGSTLNLRVNRSKKTGKCKGFAFVQFHDPEVAKIVADAMNGYFLMEKRLVCNVVPMDKLHPNLFTSKWYRNKNGRNEAIEVVNRKRSKDEMQKRTDRYLSREAKRLKKLADLGIDYGFTGSVAAASTEEGKARTVSVDEPEIEENQRTSAPKTPVKDKLSSSVKSAKKSSKKSAKKDKLKNAVADVKKLATPAEKTPKKKEAVSAVKSFKKSSVVKADAEAKTPKKRFEDGTAAPSTKKKKKVKSSIKKSKKI